MKLGIIILAAGKGTRMHSRIPKVLHHLAGKPLLQHVIDCATQLNPEKIVVVYGHGGDLVRQRLAQAPVEWVEQAEQKGTGHAVAQALPAIEGMERILVLYGDVPLTREETLAHLLERSANGLGVLTVELANPHGYGRIVRNDCQQVERIVEQKDANAAEQQIREVNSGIMCLDRINLGQWIGRLRNENAQSEYYLTDIIAMAVQDGVPVEGIVIDDEWELMGINDRQQLATLERQLQSRQVQQLMLAGVTLRDPGRFDLRGTLQHGTDVVIDINVILEGEVILGNEVIIGPNCILRNCSVADGSEILANSVIENANIGSECRIGPFSRIRPGTHLMGNNHVGNFVELKNSQIAVGSKINHLSYIGDCQMGERVNIGAGTITCNYDGANKFQTLIGSDSFIGSNTALVAPVSIGNGATIGAGSTINKDAPEQQLTVARARQTTIPGWQRPKKKEC